MPVTDNVNVVWKVLPIVLAPDGTAICQFRRFLGDGSAIGQIEMDLTAAEVTGVLNVAPPAGVTVLDYLTGALYNLAISKGLFTGTVS